MPSAARAWNRTMSAFLKTQGCTKVGDEKSMWEAKSNDHQILIATHIDDFIISCVHRPTLDSFRNALLARFDGTTDGAIQTYLGCEIERDMLNGTTTLSQKHYTEDILRTYGFWDSLPLTTLPPHTPSFPKTTVILHLSACFTYVIAALWEVWATSST